MHLHAIPGIANAEVINQLLQPRLLHPPRLPEASASCPSLRPYSSNILSGLDTHVNLSTHSPPLPSSSRVSLQTDRSSVPSRRSARSYNPDTHIAVPSILSVGGGIDSSLRNSTLVDQGLRAVPAGECNTPLIEPLCIRPTDVKRYERNGRIQLRGDNGDTIKIEANTRSFSSSKYPERWEPQVHVEGARYYTHSSRRYFTDEKLCVLPDEDLVLINRTVDYLEEQLKGHGYTDADSLEIVLELVNEDQCGYYIADNKEETIFWLHEYDAQSMVSEVQGVVPPEHLALATRTMYWLHYGLFPNHQKVSPEIVAELHGYLLWYNTDSTTSRWSTSPFSGEDLQKLKADVISIDNKRTDAKFAAPIVGRLMYALLYQSFLNYHGQPVARLASNHNIMDDPSTASSWLFRILSLILLCAPHSYLRSMEMIWVDKIIHSNSWNRLTADFVAEWSSLQLMATVLFAGNMSFLAIQSVDRGIDVRSLSQIASCYSTVLSVYCIILSLLLIRAPTIKSWRGDSKDAEQIQKYLCTRPGGLKLLAVAFSLPFTLIFWALACLLVAFFCWSFQLNPILPSAGRIARVLLSLPWAFFLSLGIWLLVLEYQASSNPLVERSREWATCVASAYTEAKGKAHDQLQRVWCIQSILPRRSDAAQDQEYNLNDDVIEIPAGV
ncbi:hypothetical protein OE88DRAFT_1806367 [Heliocybe sulcata]|uniref:WW domain-containing protein n=1 Tax=Heliocybe sulcata TaxID=5364 RepID=A0A5C3NIJ0_9AGAM|nr:hypothetical protein OE88DRAFT_1806367 [Heliocybe sulcata]